MTHLSCLVVSQIGVPAIMTMLAERGIQPSAGMMSRTMGIQMCGDVLGNYVVSHQLRPLQLGFAVAGTCGRVADGRVCAGSQVGAIFSSSCEDGPPSSMWVYVLNLAICLVGAIVLRCFVLPHIPYTPASKKGQDEQARGAEGGDDPSIAP